MPETTRIRRIHPQAHVCSDEGVDSRGSKDFSNLPERLLASFEPLHVFGEGGMARLLLGRQRSLNREVMIKVLRRGDSHRRRLALRNEARVLAGLDHPNILTILDAGEDWLAMRWVRGGDLTSIAELPARGTDLVQLMRALVCATRALEHAHRNGVIHRDLKPDNMVLGQNQEAQIIDWGLAVSIAPSESGEWLATPIHDCECICSGTQGFIVPELVAGRIGDIGTAADTAQLGACLYEILTGEPPFLGRDEIESLQLSSRALYVPIRDRNPHAPAVLAGIAQRCLSREPELRPSLIEVRAVLSEWISGGTQPVAVRTRLQRTRRPTPEQPHSEQAGGRGS